jgi:hypothetical protein
MQKLQTENMKNKHKTPYLSTHKVYVSYTFSNTPLPPLNEVPTKGFSL